MDGFKKCLNDSVQLKLSFSLSLSIFVVAVVAGVFSFVSAFDEAHELQDDTLRQVAALFVRQPLPLAFVGNDGRAVLKIQDTGPGIDVAERERVFDPFYRTLGNEQVGSGLGLAIAKAIADRTGAEIRLEFSDEVKRSGLRVCVFVPVADSYQGAPRNAENS